jgi:hypothetical protein
VLTESLRLEVPACKGWHFVKVEASCPANVLQDVKVSAIGKTKFAGATVQTENRRDTRLARAVVEKETLNVAWETT